jgi:hypothetical protein
MIESYQCPQICKCGSLDRIGLERLVPDSELDIEI